MILKSHILNFQEHWQLNSVAAVPFNRKINLQLGRS